MEKKHEFKCEIISIAFVRSCFAFTKSSSIGEVQILLKSDFVISKKIFS